MFRCLLLDLRHALKRSRYWSIVWSVKLCWLLTMFHSDVTLVQVIDVPCWFLIKSFLRYSFSRCLQAVHCFGFHGARAKVNGAYYNVMSYWPNSCCSPSHCRQLTLSSRTAHQQVHYAYNSVLHILHICTRLNIMRLGIYIVKHTTETWVFSSLRFSLSHFMFIVIMLVCCKVW